MPAEAIAGWLFSLGEAWATTTAITVAKFATVINSAVVALANYGYSSGQQRKAARRARDAYNASLQDRAQTLRGTLLPRQLVMGRVRVGGAIAFVGTTGTTQEKLWMVIALASHRIEAVDQVYFNDELVPLDGSGYPSSGAYLKTRTESGVASMSLSSGAGSVVLPQVPIEATVTFQPSGEQASASVAGTIAGSTVSVSGFGGHTGTAQVHYTYSVSTPMARVRWMLGDDSQAAFADLVAAFPSQWTTDHRLRGVAYLVVELDYDPDVYPSGIPNVSAVVRGANQVYDPRTLATGYTDNPALLMRWYMLHPLGGRRAAPQLDDATVIAAANVCDTSVDYGDGATALYRAGLVASTEQPPAEVLDELAEAMAGKWGFSGGVLRLRAGAMGAVLDDIDEDWLAGGVSVQPRRPRAQLANVLTGAFADADNAFRLVQFPRVVDAPAVAEDGAELSNDVEFAAIGRSGQAQQVAAVLLREARQALTVTLSCNLRAYPLQVFDVVTLTLERFGWSGKEFEVIERKYSHGGGIELTLKETSASVYAFGTSFPTVDPAPNTALPNPAVVPTVGTVTATSSATALQDGSVVSRVALSWPAIADLGVVRGGFVEVAYVDTSQADAYRIVRADSLTGHILVGLRTGYHYAFKARAVNGAGVRGNWSAVTVYQVTLSGKVGTGGIAPDSVAKVREAYSASLSSGVTHAIPISFTMPFTGKVLATLTLTVSATNSTGSTKKAKSVARLDLAFPYLTNHTSAVLNGGGGFVTRNIADGEEYEQSLAFTSTLDVIAGEVVDLGVYLATHTSATITLSFNDVKLRVEEIYR